MTDFDVIVVGSGMSGGWVAKEMCEKGFKTAVIERDRAINPVKEYTPRFQCQRNVTPFLANDLDQLRNGNNHQL